MEAHRAEPCWARFTTAVPGRGTLNYRCWSLISILREHPFPISPHKVSTSTWSSTKTPVRYPMHFCLGLKPDGCALLINKNSVGADKKGMAGYDVVGGNRV